MNEKKEKVINAAKKLFTQYGYYKVSMDEIAKESKVTKKTIYAYFKDKNSLIEYLLVEEIDKMKKLADKIDKKNISFEDKIHEIITLQLDYKSNSKLLGYYFEEVEQGKLKIDKERCNVFNKTIQSELKIRLDKAMIEGYIKKCDTEIISFLIYKIYIALMFEFDKKINKEEVTENIMNILKSWLLN